MPDTKTLLARDAAVAEVVAQFGKDNLESVLEVYRAFADRVDYRQLVGWTIKDPLEDLLMPLFLHAVVEITKGLRLGELAEHLAASEGGERPGWSYEWAARQHGPHGIRDLPMCDEDTAREFVSSPFDGGGRYSYALVRRSIGPWTEVPT